MKKLVLLMVFIAISSHSSDAQYALPKGANQFNAGLGLSYWGIPIYIGLDHGVHKDISVGGELSYRSFYDTYHDIDYRLNVFGISVNGNYHFNSLLNIPRNWDFYAGLNIGFYIWNLPPGYYGSHSTGLGLGAQIGGRYYFTNKFAVNLEFGGGNEFDDGKIGITVKL